MGEHATLVSVEEYLSTSYKPACEYLEGTLLQKPTPTWSHAIVQARIATLVNQGFPEFRAGTEVTVRIGGERFRIPDVLVQAASAIQKPYPQEPVYLCVEVLSPEDRLSETIAKCEAYHAWGVPHVWIVDPEERRAWEFPRGQRLHEVSGDLRAGALAVPLADVFSVL